MLRTLARLRQRTNKRLRPHLGACKCPRATVTMCRTPALLPHAHFQTAGVTWKLLGCSGCRCLPLSSRRAPRRNTLRRTCRFTGGVGGEWRRPAARLERAWQRGLRLKRLGHLGNPICFQLPGLHLSSCPFSPASAVPFIPWVRVFA